MSKAIKATKTNPIEVIFLDENLKETVVGVANYNTYMRVIYGLAVTLFHNKFVEKKNHTVFKFHLFSKEKESVLMLR